MEVRTADPGADDVQYEMALAGRGLRNVLDPEVGVLADDSSHPADATPTRSVNAHVVEPHRQLFPDSAA
jgi:hypothetical protein